ncbi:MAG: ABC transporter, partial [Kovacikia sp.]
MQLGFQSALYNSNTKLSRALDADIVLVNPQARNTQNLSTFSRRRLYQAKDIPGVKSGEAFYSNLITWKHPDTHKETAIQVIGF